MFAQQKFLLNKREKNGDLSALNRPAVMDKGEADFSKQQGTGCSSTAASILQKYRAQAISQAEQRPLTADRTQELLQMMKMI